MHQVRRRVQRCSRAHNQLTGALKDVVVNCCVAEPLQLQGFAMETVLVQPQGRGMQGVNDAGGACGGASGRDEEGEWRHSRKWHRRVGGERQWLVQQQWQRTTERVVLQVHGGKAAAADACN